VDYEETESLVMAKKAPKQTSAKTVETLKHKDAKRKNIPTAEYQSVLRKEEDKPKTIKCPRNTDLDPQLVWRGKDEQDWSDLVVHAPPLYIQEKVQPKVLIDDLLRQSKETRSQEFGAQIDLFADFNGIPEGVDRTDFYQHDQNWSNRMILGDSLQVMASLAEREGLRGKVQCIYIDPPYGIKFNSNFQWSTTSHDVKDGNAAHITREPEQVKAFRDTWRDGIHSYLTYLRDRLTVARDLLSESGLIFVQIGDENVHRVRAVMDEVFGEANFISTISVQKTSYATADFIPNLFDQIFCYAKSLTNVKYRKLYNDREFEKDDDYESRDLASAGAGASTFDFHFQGHSYHPGMNRHWKTQAEGLARAAKAERLFRSTNSLRYKRFNRDFPVTEIHNTWTDTMVGSFHEPRRYVVETSQKVVARCLLMASDPGDLVLDPTCGSGTTAYVAEQWVGAGSRLIHHVWRSHSPARALWVRGILFTCWPIRLRGNGKRQS
jgi:adenine-specific DNA-methyltransferase